MYDNNYRPCRKSLRLKNYDYSNKGAYFVTICTHERFNYFEQYPVLKQIVTHQWQNLPMRFPEIQLDEFIVMPNHIHGIIWLTGWAPVKGAPTNKSHNVNKIVGAGLAPARRERRVTIGDVIGAYKSLCVYDWLKHVKAKKLQALGKFWQKNFYEHVIRNEEDLNQIRQYIQCNPSKWDDDENNPKNWASAGRP